nr:translation initiation factor 2 [Symbiobacterium terraclitae]
MEERVRGLRTSRRILMNLLAAQERERRALIARLEAENGRLQRQTARFARAVLERNIRIVRLEESLRQQNGTSLG